MDFASQRQALLIETKKKIAASVNEDTYLIQCLATVDDLTTQLNQMSKRLREWHGYIIPEVDHKIKDHEHFISLLAAESYEQLVDEYANGMQADVGDKYDTIVLIAKKAKELYNLKTELLDRIEVSLQAYMPNMLAIAGTTITARLLSGAGSLRQLAIMPASTVQLLGAEKALFRHLRSGARSPKYGHIYNHQLIQRSAPDIRGKAARALADKLSMAAKLDYFKGDFLGDGYLKDLEKRFGING